MAPNDKGTAVSTNAEVDSPNAAKKEETSGSFTLMGLLNIVGAISVFCILVGTLAGMPGATDIKDTKKSAEALAANNFQSIQITSEIAVSGSTITYVIDQYNSLAYRAWVVDLSVNSGPSDMSYFSYAYGECDTYALSNDDNSRRLVESTHHRSPKFASIEVKLAELTANIKRHLDTKVSDECDDRDDECKSAGQGASALFIISFILSFANAVLAFLTMKGSDDSKTKISAALHVLVILLTSIAVGLFTLDCTNLLDKDAKEITEKTIDAIAAEYGGTASYTYVYTNGATFSCGITAIVLSVVLLLLRLIPQAVADKPADVKEGENLVA